MKSTLTDDESGEIISRSAAYETSRPVVVFDIDGKRLSLQAPNRICAWRATTLFTKEPETIAWINGMPGTAILYDVGANIGLYSVWAAFTRGVTVMAFEPEASNFAILNENIRGNALSDHCTPFCLGVSDVTGLGRMMVQSGGSGQSGHQVQLTAGERFKVADQSPAYQGISTVTLDHVVYDRGFPCPTHLKIDVDGLEPAVVRGAQQLIRDPRLKSVMIELMIKRDAHNAIIETLVEAGFEKNAAMEQAILDRTEGVPFTGNILFTRR